MRDINFFRPYKTKDKGDSEKYYYKIGALIVAILIIGTFSINTAKIVLLNNEIKEYEAKLNDKEIKEKIVLAEEVNRQLEALNNYNGDLDSVLEDISSRDVVTNQILESINKTIPRHVSFKSMNINSGLINIQAISKDRKSIGEIQHNLKSINYLKDVHVENISTAEAVEGEYSFTIKCSLDRGEN